ncbi:hypothetical protein ILUMI_13764 [Ignelater luminosus]|uniref:Uncharacterized protein n=1 Tax=Ignelater luminosus TaxID=2038154 RepID=A0A8K0GAL5_IGNLU|nr:hypothetical protein ILUMI_13764 [Ignelater luminosus]
MKLRETSQLSLSSKKSRYPAEFAIDPLTKSLETQAGPSMDFASRQDFLEFLSNNTPSLDCLSKKPVSVIEEQGTQSTSNRCSVTLPNLIPSDDDKMESGHLSPILTETIDQDKADHEPFLKNQLSEDQLNLMNF